MTQRDTPDRILDVAERHFAERGYARSSLRGMTGEAGVNLAAVHYHFGSKEALFRAVVERRIAPVNAERLRQLDAIEARGPAAPPAADELLRALFAPAMRFADPDQGAHAAFLRLMGRVHAESSERLEALRPLFHEIHRRFLAAFARALPEVPRPELERRLHFSIGVMVHTLLHPEFRCAGGAQGSDAEASGARDGASALDSLVTFASAGMAASPQPEGRTCARS